MAAMAILKVAQIGHPVLRQKARDVSREELLTPGFQAFIDSMIETDLFPRNLPNPFLR